MTELSTDMMYLVLVYLFSVLAGLITLSYHMLLGCHLVQHMIHVAGQFSFFLTAFG